MRLKLFPICKRSILFRLFDLADDRPDVDPITIGLYYHAINTKMNNSILDAQVIKMHGAMAITGGKSSEC